MFRYAYYLFSEADSTHVYPQGYKLNQQTANGVSEGRKSSDWSAVSARPHPLASACKNTWKPCKTLQISPGVLRKKPITVFSAFAGHLGELTGEECPTHSAFYFGLRSLTTETPDSRTGTWITQNWHPHKTYRNFIHFIQKRHLYKHVHTENNIITS